MEVIVVMRMFCESSIQYENGAFIYFLGFEKAFDKVNWMKLLGILTSFQVDWGDISEE